jgi:hypothetical protein
MTGIPAHRISPLLLSAYFVVLVALSMLKTRPIRGRGANLLKAFFPSWKFFEDCGDIAVLFFRVAPRGQELGPWQECLPTPKRSLRTLLFNPEGCFLLASGSLLQQLASDLQEMEDGKESAFADSVSYGLVRNLVEYRITQSGGDVENLRYQFEVRAISTATSSRDKGEVMLLSPIYED